ncbi:cyclic GMP-AMP synthase-like [Saccostrea echinata]|uniref:cyclic GMP-AMP synthase-like n=1 Tax=Saccostrea echinata TaxID=191078 RepID=UPI002A81EDC5|nr:cyclic GMP-AMP synthase-like [Saccostrea echinata]
MCKQHFKNQHGLSIHISKMHPSIVCGVCQRNDFKNEHGLSIHMSKVHHQDSHSSGRRETELYSRKVPQHGHYHSKDRKDEKHSARQRPSTAGGHRKDGYQGRFTTTHSPHGSAVNEKCKSYSGPEREHKGDTRTWPKSVPPKFGEIHRTDTYMSEHVIKEVAKVVQASPHTVTKPQEKAGGRGKPREPLLTERSPSSLSNSTLSCLASDKSKLLTILKAGIICPKEDSKLRVDRVNVFVQNLEETISRVSDFPLELFKSGSYYDKTKIDYADEFDFMFYPKANFEADFTNCPPGFCKIKKGRTTSQDFDKMFNKDGYLVPDFFKEKMFQIFKKCIESPGFREGRRTKRKPRAPESPAFTVFYDLQLQGKPPIDIDLVPAIRVDGWPSNFRKLHAKWLSDDHAKEAMKCFHAVTKTFPGKQADGGLLWRVSFSHAEKKLINHADYTDKGVRKTIFKILKKLKEDIKTDCPGIEKFCSYHLKMFMLGFFDRHKDFSEKNEELLFNQSIKELVKCLQSGEIRNYFIPSDNILKYVPDNEKALVARKLSEYI